MCDHTLPFYDPQPLPGQTIAVWFSRGAASAVAAMIAVRAYQRTNEVRVLTNPVKEEHSDNTRFEKDVAGWIGVEIEHVTNHKFPSASCDDVWRSVRGMSFPKGAPCTVELKKSARQQWEQKHSPDWHVLGFTSDEKKRHDRFTLTERSNVLPVLIWCGIDKQACMSILASNGIRPPKMYDLGFPNANCIGCVKATSPTYWNAVRREFPDVFRKRAELSRELGARLVRVKSERVFLDELDPQVKGRPMKSLTLECGTFCEE